MADGTMGGNGLEWRFSKVYELSISPGSALYFIKSRMSLKQNGHANAYVTYWERVKKKATYEKHCRLRNDTHALF